MSQCRQNYHEESEALVNRQINMELNAYYQYLTMVQVYLIVLAICCHHISFIDLNHHFRLRFSIATTWR